MLGLLRPRLEHCVQLWAPQQTKGVKLCESLQGRATKTAKALQGKACEETVCCKTPSQAAKPQDTKHPGNATARLHLPVQNFI